jgi:O-acetyl-ADP-ribose deacetylase (regulator of RNase III)
VGTAAITGAGKLKAKQVIHAVGPRMGEGDEDNKLKNAVESVLLLASGRGLKSISMPAISSGIFGFPKDRCAAILVGISKEFLEKNPESPLETVEFCVFDDQTAGYFREELDALG